MILPQWWGHLWVDISWLGSKPDFDCNLALVTEHPWAYLNAHVHCQATQEATEALLCPWCILLIILWVPHELRFLGDIGSAHISIEHLVYMMVLNWCFYLNVTLSVVSPSHLLITTFVNCNVQGSALNGGKSTPNDGTLWRLVGFSSVCLCPEYTFLYDQQRKKVMPILMVVSFLLFWKQWEEKWV